jgi:endonuclease/exonuclease/phosphatase family metal-dependent hydrolase
MKKLLLLTLTFVLAVGVEAKPKKTQELNLRIGTYNIWAPQARGGHIKKGNATEARNWKNSKQAVAELIVKLDCDLIGLQEVTNVSRDDLAELVKKVGGKKYELWWEDCYPHTKKKDMGNAIFFNKKKFALENRNIYFFSPTPEKVSIGWDEKKFYRAAMVTVVTHKKSGRKFFFMATHGPGGGRVANGHAGRLLVEFDKKYNTEGLPTIVVGDMNAWPGEKFYSYMTEYYEDSFAVAENVCSTEVVGTTNHVSENESRFLIPRNRIDHIYVRSTDKGKFKVKNYEVNRDKLNCGGEMHYPSDHNPVVVDITLK